MEFTNDILAQSALAQVAHRYGSAFGGVPQLLVKPFVSKLIDNEHRLAVVLLLLFFGSEFSLLYLNMVFLCQLANGLYIGALLDLHDEAHGVSCLAATKTLEDTFAGRDGEGARLLIVEGAETNKIGTAFLERHIVAYHIFDAGSGEYSIDGFARYHWLYGVECMV